MRIRSSNLGKMPLLRPKMTSECTAVDERGNEHVLAAMGWVPFGEWKEEFVKFWKSGVRITS